MKVLQEIRYNLRGYVTYFKRQIGEKKDEANNKWKIVRYR